MIDRIVASFVLTFGLAMLGLYLLYSFQKDTWLSTETSRDLPASSRKPEFGVWLGVSAGLAIIVTTSVFLTLNK